MAGEPALQAAVRLAADALDGLAPEAEPEATFVALGRLADVVAGCEGSGAVDVTDGQYGL